MLWRKQASDLNCDMNRELAEDGSIKGRVLDQVVFFSDQQIAYAKRFIADQVLLVDGTSETNRLGLTLLVVVGVNNTGKNFSEPYSFCRSEGRVSFDFLFETLDHFIFQKKLTEKRYLIEERRMIMNLLVLYSELVGGRVR